MCTVTFIPRASGYALAMNRDEQRKRVAGLPPKLFREYGRAAIGPAEPTGGTWINLNDAGVTLALINWYSVRQQVKGNAVSRGTIIQKLRWATSSADVQAGLLAHSLTATNPFRLIGVFPSVKEVVEWQWDLQRLKRVTYAWQSSIWISSGHDEPGAQRIRTQVFQQALQQASAGSLAWLRRLHRSHAPERGAYSICMHREDAVTVSNTEILVKNGQGTMRYIAGAPCEGQPGKELSLKMQNRRPLLERAAV